MKKHLLRMTYAMVLASALSFAQKTETFYYKGSEEVDAKADWEYKGIKKTVIKGNDYNEIFEKWDKRGRKVSDIQIRVNKQNKSGTYSSTVYDYDSSYKETTVTTLSEKAQQTKYKCTSLEDKVIYPDKLCTEEATLDERTLHQWVKNAANASLADSNIKSIFAVRFSPVSPPKVIKINGRDIEQEGIKLTHFEEDMVEKISKMSPEIYKGKLRKGLGKEKETIYHIPIYININ